MRSRLLLGATALLLGVAVVAGATDLSVLMHMGLARPRVVLDVSGLDALRGIWLRNGEHWNLRPRFAEDFVLAVHAAEPIRSAAGERWRKIAMPCTRRLPMRIWYL